MIHDRDLLDRLSGFPPLTFDDAVFRATRQGLDPLTGSYAGGRWAPRDSTSVLYTSVERDGALAEITFHLSQLDPWPSKPIKLHQLHVSARSVIRLLRADLSGLGVEWGDYGSLNYARTQQIGAAVAFLECDGLIAPSARWSCENLMLFMDNHRLKERLDLKHTETVDWIAWGRQHGRL